VEEAVLTLLAHFEHPPVRRRDHEPLVGWGDALGIAKEEETEGDGEDERDDCHRMPRQPPDHRHRTQGAGRHPDDRPGLPCDGH